MQQAAGQRSTDPHAADNGIEENEKPDRPGGEAVEPRLPEASVSRIRLQL